jgi:hypothetical protein
VNVRKRQPEKASIILDGLLEGPIPSEDNGEERLRQWVIDAKEEGFSFFLSMEGQNFNLLADDSPIDVSDVPSTPEALTTLLEQILLILPPDLHQHVFSTVRSTEYLQNTKRQSLYTVRSNHIHVQQKTIPWEAKVASQHISRKLTYSIILTLAMTLVLFGPPLYRVFLSPPDLSQQMPFQINLEDIGDFIDVQVETYNPKTGKVLLTICRTAQFPLNWSQLASAKESIVNARDVNLLFSLERIVMDGVVPVEAQNAEGITTMAVELNVRALLETECIQHFLAIPEPENVTRLKLHY